MDEFLPDWYLVGLSVAAFCGGLILLTRPKNRG